MTSEMVACSSAKDKSVTMDEESEDDYSSGTTSFMSEPSVVVFLRLHASLHMSTQWVLNILLFSICMSMKAEASSQKSREFSVIRRQLRELAALQFPVIP